MYRMLVVGATSCVGRNLIEYLAGGGNAIHALLRPGADARQFERRCVAVHEGQPLDVALLQRLIADVDIVVNCVASREESRCLDFNPRATRAVLDACKGQGITRYVHLSCLDAYPLRHHFGTDERQPVDEKHPDPFSRSMAVCERHVMRYYREFGVPVVILRAGYIYGPWDRHFIPALVQELREGTLCYLGRGEQALAAVYVGNLVGLVPAAIEMQEAVGKAYNVTDGEYVSKRQFFEALADALDLPYPDKHASLWWARLACRWGKLRPWFLPSRRRPQWNWSRLRLLGYNQDFAIFKAQNELGYSPRWSFDEGLYQTIRWFRERGQLPEAVVSK